MFTYAVVGYFDCNTENCIKDLWNGLSVNNITHYGVQSKGKRPHITLADYDYIDIKVFSDMVDIFCEDKKEIDISLKTLGTFLSTGTLFLAPTILKNLINFHSKYHDFFKLLNDNKESLYLPDKWYPHCTIASRLDENDMIQAFKYCKKSFKGISGKLTEMALIEIELNDNKIAIEDKVIKSKQLK